MRIRNLFVAGTLAFLVGCEDSMDSQSEQLPPRTWLPPITADVAYYGNVGSMDSAGKGVTARMLFIMKSDSSFKMYVSPASLPLYHPLSKFDLMRIRGHFLSFANGVMTFSVDSSLSSWDDGFPIYRGTVDVAADPPKSKLVVLNFLSRNEHIMAKSEFQVWHADSNRAAQFDLGL